jgi:hypothetical protein
MDYLYQIEQLRSYNQALKLRMEHIKERLRKISEKTGYDFLQENVRHKQ